MTVLADGGGAIHLCSDARAVPVVRSARCLSVLIVVCLPAMRAHAQAPSAEGAEQQNGETTEASAHSNEGDSGVNEAEDQVDQDRTRVAPVLLAPDEVGNQIRAATEESAGLFDHGPISDLSRPWTQFNDGLEKETGLRLGFAYTVLYQQATSGPGVRDAVGGDFDFFGRWRLIETDTGTRGHIGFNLEHRHRFTTIAPASLGENIGSIWPTTRAFGTFDWRLRELWWRQSFLDDRFEFHVGTLNQKHFSDIYSFKSQNKFFLGTPFSDSPTIAFPRHGFGAMTRVSPLPEFHVTATIGDANGTGEVGSFDSLFDDGELFATLDLSLTPTFEGLGDGKYGLTLWHRDAREEAGIPSGGGVSLLAEQEIASNTSAFARYGYGDGADLTIEHLFAAGAVIREPFDLAGDAFGVGLSWARQSDPSLDDQWGAEAFYRIQLGNALQLTPGFQIIVNPSESRENDVIGVFMLRCRVQF